MEARSTMSQLRVPGFVLVTFLISASATAAGHRLVGWSELGMHCMDGDYSLMAILPPYNTIHAQLIDPSGKLVRSPGQITVTYEAVADAGGSINTTSAGKTNFWNFAPAIFGVTLPVDTGLAGMKMPGAANTPQAMVFDTASSRFDAEGIPITPIDDSGAGNAFPMMRLTARDAGGSVLATTEISLPVSDEVSCGTCHATGSNSAAKPSSGWASDPSAQRDSRLNILRLHDELEGRRASFVAALAAVGYRSEGLEATATQGTPILCAKCHATNALGMDGVSGVPPLTRAMHGGHALVVDLATSQPLGESTSRDSCYLCHPGANTRCLRDAMGSAGKSDGAYSMDCQQCHGTLAELAGTSRRGWLDEPSCGNCHTGTETANSGELRYESAFDAPGHYRVPSNTTFSANANSPVAGSSLFRTSRGHGGLFCPACHGAPHAIAPSRKANDDGQSIAISGSPGVIGECSACHASVPTSTTGGPHGMHPTGASWVSGHEKAGRSGCTGCHGVDYRGGPLSAMLANRNLPTKYGTKTWWRGYRVGCYSCHSGPDSESATKNRAPSVSAAQIHASEDGEGKASIVASDLDGDALAYRIVNKPKHGSAGISGTTMTYRPDPGFSGEDSFTVAARDTALDSNLATVSVTVFDKHRRRPVRP
ncbi:MAG: Ig-like domain-containing protein [Thermoanaerobaculia bacterium]|nr:Ig-like domain-containing protein [Thermoanaerobaculia bacterium]